MHRRVSLSAPALLASGLTLSSRIEHVTTDMCKQETLHVDCRMGLAGGCQEWLCALDKNCQFFWKA